MFASVNFYDIQEENGLGIDETGKGSLIILQDLKDKGTIKTVGFLELNNEPNFTCDKIMKV